MKPRWRWRRVAWAAGGLALLLTGWVLFSQIQTAAVADAKVEGRPLRAWLVDLNSGVPQVRETAREALNRIPPQPRAESLIRLVERSGVGLDAAYERHRTRLPRRLNSWLVRNFRSHEWVMARRTAAAELRRCTDELAPERLGRLLYDPDRVVAAHAGLALGARGPRAVPVLREAVGGDNLQVRELACNSLAVLGKDAVSAMPELLAVLEENNPVLNRLAIMALSRMAPHPVPALGQWLAEGNVWRRRQALEVLDQMQPLPLEAAPWVRRAAQDEDAEARRTATRLLGRVRPFGAEDEQRLRRALNDEDPGLRISAAIGIGFTGNRAVGLIPDLKQRLNDDHPQVRTNAQRSLTRLAAAGVANPLRQQP
jgi:HEAT repeat protein